MIIDKLVLIAIASEFLVDKDVFSTSWESINFSELLSLTFDNIGTFITQSQVILKLSDCFEYDLSLDHTPKILDATYHVNDMFTQVGDVISLLDIFHLFIVEDPVVLTQEPFNGKADILSDM